MKKATFSSPKIARMIQRQYGSNAKVVKIDIKHADQVREYVKKIEVAHKKAASSTVSFGP